MAELIQATCPKCNKVFKAPVALRGKKVKCKGCGQVIPVIEKQEEDEWAKNLKGYGVTVEADEGVPRCPFCASELESAADAVCLKCGYNLQTRQRMRTEIYNPLTGEDYFMWYLPPVLACLGVIFCIVFMVFIWTEWPDLEPIYLGWIQTEEWAAVYTTVFLGFIIFGCASFAIKRFVFQPTPPQMEKGAVSASSGDEDDD
jgi:hypothetical protein